MGPTERILIISSLLLFVSVIASKGASRFEFRRSWFFSGSGFWPAPEGPGGLVFHDYGLVQTIGALALISILFSGGLDTDVRQIKPILKPGLWLSIFGVIFSTLLVGAFANIVLHFGAVEGALLGAIVSATDVAAVFTVLRAKNVSLKPRIKPLLEFESAVNDPMTVFLGTGLLALYSAGGDVGILGLVPRFFQQMILGALFGYLSGRFIVFFINRLKLEFEGLYPVLTISLILFTYGITQAVGGSGFLAVYVAGIVLGNGNFLKRKSLILFHDGLAWLMQIFMFLAMGLIVSPRELWQVAPVGMALSLFLVFVARPVSVALCLWPANSLSRSKSWCPGAGCGARFRSSGTYPLTANLPEAQIIFHLVFFVVFTSVLLQGTFMAPMAKLLGMDAPLQHKFRYPLEYVPTGNLKSELAEVRIPTESGVVGKSLLDLQIAGRRPCCIDSSQWRCHRPARWDSHRR